MFTDIRGMMETTWVNLSWENIQLLLLHGWYAIGGRWVKPLRRQSALKETSAWQPHIIYCTYVVLVYMVKFNQIDKVYKNYCNVYI